MDRYWVSCAGLQKAGGSPEQFSRYFGFCKVLQGDPTTPDRIYIDERSATLLSQYCCNKHVDLKVYNCHPDDEAMFIANQRMLDQTFQGWRREMGFDETQTQTTQEDAPAV